MVWGPWDDRVYFLGEAMCTLCLSAVMWEGMKKNSELGQAPFPYPFAAYPVCSGELPDTRRKMKL